MLNPYAQGGWPNPRNPYSVNIGTWPTHSSHRPSIYGALPTRTLPSHPTILTFRFTSLNSVLNCKVIGPNNKPHFTIMTLPHGHASTVFYDYQGKQVASVDWHAQPLVEVYDIVPKQQAARWIGVAPSSKSRTMEVNGKSYAWISNTTGMNLVTVGPCQPELVAKVAHELDAIQLQIAAEAMQPGLLESIIVATAMLYCGRFA